MTNVWLNATNGRQQKSKNKLSNRENVDVEMAATVLPARNAYNDYHVKYHSVSGGSALSQSMKYAEAWLYGSWNVRPSIRSTFLNFDHDFAQGFDHNSPSAVCYCAQNCTVNGHKKKNCRKCTSRNFTTVQGFGTVRNNRVYRNLICNERNELPLYKDPYDIVRQSRLSAMKCATVRAKSYSPSKRKHCAPLMAANRLPSPDAQTSEDGTRKSILECNINPYDLVKKSPEDDGCSLMSDDDLLEVCTAKSNKKQKSTLRLKFKSKIQDSKPAKMLMDNLKNMKKDEKTDITGISIAGQKIRVFNTPGRVSDAESTDDWISDPVDEEPVAEKPPLVEEVEQTPKRPPRRKAVKVTPKSEPTSRSSAIYQNYQVQPPAKCPSAGPPPTPYTDIKSILKKPLATSSEIDSDAAAKLSNCTVPPVKNTPSGDTGKNFYLTTFNSNKQTDRKVKKQVQFKGMQEQTVEDESGSKSNVDVDVVVAETGYDTENATATPERRNADQTLSADDKSNAEHHLRDHERNDTSLPLSQIVHDNQSITSSSSAENCTFDSSKSGE